MNRVVLRPTFTYLPFLLQIPFLRRVFLLGGAALVFGAARVAQAQTPVRTFVPQYHGWFVINSEPRFTKQLGLRAELIFRRAERGRVWQQIQARVAPVWNPRPDLQLSVGYLFSRNFRYGDYPVLQAFSENRLYQQVLLRSVFGRFALAHRYRLEQRWSRPAVANEPDRFATLYTNRARYQARLVRPLGPVAAMPRGPYAAVSGEVFVGFGRRVGANIFDQGRAYGGFGWQLTPSTAVELGYLHQLIQQGNGRIFEANHTLQVTLNLNPNWAGDAVGRPETNDNSD